MSLRKIMQSIALTFRNAGKVVRDSLKTLLRSPHILAYPALAVFFISVTFPFVNEVFFKIWDGISASSLFSTETVEPHYLKIFSGLVTFSLFYTLFISAYFTCAVSAGVWAELEKHPNTMAQSLKMVGSRFFKVSLFALLALFLVPLTIIALWRKLFSGIKPAFEVLGRAFGMNIALLAPGILSGKEGVFGTIRTTSDTLGRSWRENLVIKIGMYVVFFLIIFAGSAVKVIEHRFNNDQSAHFAGWLILLFFTAISYVLTRVIGGVFTTVLYYRVKTGKNT